MEPQNNPTQPQPIASKQPQLTTIEPKPKKPILSVLALILAFVGIGFGVYGMFFSGASCPAVKECQQCEECKECTCTDSQKPCECPKADKSSSNYIYIGKWGIKINTANADLKHIKYIYEDITGVQEIKFTGSMTTTEQLPAYAKDEWSIVTLARYPKDEYDYNIGSPGSKITTIGNYDYILFHAQVAASGDEQEINEESEVNAQLMKILSDPSSYSEF